MSRKTEIETRRKKIEKLQAEIRTIKSGCLHSRTTREEVPSGNGMGFFDRAWLYTCKECGHQWKKE